ncbi:MAG: tetratricopeptide repeat protein [Dehalococcoidales bacterium]|nr:tetratricopeptide repeat protein [Dehalococcoidales bacterium]
MLNEQEKPVRLKNQRNEQAIALAMQGRWREAIEVNKSILADNGQEVNAYNRLGRAYMELGDYAHAREAYNKAVEVDPYNAIAKKNLHRLSLLKETSRPAEDTETVEPEQFIEEIGKSGVVNLLALAPLEVRARFVAGDKISLKTKGSRLLAESGGGEYLGEVETKHALRLIKLMQGGNRYGATVVSSTEEGTAVIIREVYQHPSQSGKLSFPPKGMEAVQPMGGERMLKMEAEYEREADEEPGYTIIGGDEVEVLPEETIGPGEDNGGDEE